jgi:hypothetical protein
MSCQQPVSPSHSEHKYVADEATRPFSTDECVFGCAERHCRSAQIIPTMRIIW